MSFGLLMSPWGGHSVFPNIYKDMRHPHKYRKAVDITYAFTFGLDMSLALIGVLMFGDLVRDEVSGRKPINRRKITDMGADHNKRPQPGV